MFLSSKNNDIVKYAKSLQDKKYSKEYNECFVESEKVIGDLINLNINVTTIFFVDKFEEKFNEILKNFTGKVYSINESIANYLSESKSSSKIFAIVKIPEKVLDFSKNSIILDNLQDPSNIGAIIRSAKAFGFDNIISINGVYPYTYKVIRSSMGHIFNVNFINLNYDELLDLKAKHNITFVCADMNGKNLKTIEKKHDNIAIIIGNEGNGVSEILKQKSDLIISIPMEKSVESLNAGIAGSILMYTLMK